MRFFNDKSLRCTKCDRDVQRLFSLNNVAISGESLQNTYKVYEWKINVTRSINLAT